MYCQIYPTEDLDLFADSKPEWCPIKCNIDDIKAEIASEITGLSEDSNKDYWLNSCLEIIDSHISGKEQE